MPSFLEDLHAAAKATLDAVSDSSTVVHKIVAQQPFDVLGDYIGNVEGMDPDFVPSDSSYRPVMASLGDIRIAARVYSDHRAGGPALAGVLQAACASLDTAIVDMIGVTKSDLAERGFPHDAFVELNRLEEAMRARRLASEVQDVRDAAVQALEETRRAAGYTGSLTFSLHFGRYAAREARMANLLRGLCALSLLAIAIVAGALLLGDNDDLSTAREIGRLGVTIPLGVLAGYLAREAASHRLTARWAANLEVQLLTMDAFTQPLPPASRDELRTELGRRALLGDPQDQIEAADVVPSVDAAPPTQASELTPEGETAP